MMGVIQEMSYSTKTLKADLNGKPIPQIFNQVIDDYEALQGYGNASAVVKGRFYSVGTNATTTSIPITTTNGLTLLLSPIAQNQLVNARLAIVIGTQLEEAVVTAVSSSGTLTLDGALSAVPAQNTPILLIPVEQSSLTGSNVILPSDSLASGNGQRTVNQLELFDGANWNQYRGNTQGTLLASATRTSQIASPITTNYNSKGVFVAFNITAASGTGGLQLQIYGVDPAGGPPILLLNATSVTTTGQRGFIVYPGASGGIAGSQEITQTSSLIVPRQFYVYIGATDGSSYTYSVGYSLIN